MKNILHSIILISYTFGSIFAQSDEFTKSSSSTSEQNFELTNSKSLYIPSLEVVIDFALQHSPMVKAKHKVVDIAREELSVTSKQWLDYIHIEGNAYYGYSDQVVINGQSIPASENSGSYLKNEQIRYFAGIGVRLPLSSFFSRSNEINIEQLNIEHANYVLEELEDKVTRTVIKEYYNLLYLKESMDTFLDMYKTLEISYLKAKKDLENGRIEFEIFAKLVASVGNAKDAYYKSKNNYYAQYLSLENIVGVSFKEELL
jgi:outer membrane protein TolC